MPPKFDPNAITIGEIHVHTHLLVNFMAETCARIYVDTFAVYIYLFVMQTTTLRKTVSCLLQCCKQLYQHQ